MKPQKKAQDYCYNCGDYEQAAYYAMLTGNTGRLQDCICANADRLLASGRYTVLREYFDFLTGRGARLSPETLLAKVMYLSSTGSFFEADQCFETVMSEFGAGDRVRYIKAVIHKARILRNKVSFEESNRCIDELLPLLDGQPMAVRYEVLIEKIHNLTMMTRLSEALDLVREMVKKCSACGDVRVRAWFERYLTMIYFYTGDILGCIREYEKSLSIPLEEQMWLKRHTMAAAAAKAYQLIGNFDKADSVITGEIALVHDWGCTKTSAYCT